jgi:hypothetical protein
MRVDEAAAQFRQSNGLRPTPEAEAIWLATLGGLIIPLPNFRWRRDIIAPHDAHHFLTGYPATFEGELCLAAWELGRGCYAHWAARLLCAGLMLVGLIAAPHAVWVAFQNGRRTVALNAHTETTVFDSAP